jgi:signal peptidase
MTGKFERNLQLWRSQRSPVRENVTSASPSNGNAPLPSVLPKDIEPVSDTRLPTKPLGGIPPQTSPEPASIRSFARTIAPARLLLHLSQFDFQALLESSPDLLKGGKLIASLGPWWSVLVVLWALGVYTLVNLILPRLVSSDLYMYLFQPTLWASLALISWLGWRFNLSSRPSATRPVVLMALLYAVCQLALFVIAGLFSGFGRSPYGHRLLIVLANLLYLATLLAAVELTRAYLANLFGSRMALPSLVFVSLFSFILLTPIGSLSKLDGLQSGFKLLGSQYLPSLSENLFATFLALLGGPLAASGYRGVLLAFEWLSPVLPDLNWFAAALLGTILPAAGMLAFYNQFVDPSEEVNADKEQPKGSSAATWAVVGVVCLLVLGFNTGIFGVRPTLIASGSMSPQLLVGDIVIARQVDPAEVQVGDIIQFRQDGVDIVHRVIEIQSNSGLLTFITKGDANGAQDDPVSESALRGVVIFKIPKVGWISIYARSLLAGIVR